MMITKSKLLIVLCSLIAIKSLPYEDGKYHPAKYNSYDDGKYYRPPNEGKYIPGDEGRYTYVYRQGLYPTDDGEYRYKHQVGPDGGKGPDKWSAGPDGSKGPNGFGGSNGPGGPNKIEYIGHKIYADKFPYYHDIIKALVDKFVSKGIVFGGQDSENYYKRMLDDDKYGIKCRYFNPELNDTEFVSQFITEQNIPFLRESIGQHYRFKGKTILGNRLALHYELAFSIIGSLNEFK